MRLQHGRCARRGLSRSTSSRPWYQSKYNKDRNYLRSSISWHAHPFAAADRPTRPQASPSGAGKKVVLMVAGMCISACVSMPARLEFRYARLYPHGARQSDTCDAGSRVGAGGCVSGSFWRIRFMR
jgi:hypothetical protein